MNATGTLPTLTNLKDQAKRLRQDLAASGHQVGHSQALELLAHQHGYRDWNTLHAAFDRPKPNTRTWQVGERITGHYLGRAFGGKLVGVQAMSGGGWFRLQIRFDAPLAVAELGGTPVLRQRISCRVGPDGRTMEKTSNGQPHVVLDGFEV